MTDIVEKSIKTKRAAKEIHRLFQYAWDWGNSKFSGIQTFEIGYNVPQQITLQSGKI